ncbi:MAG: acyl-CoA dehydrogenase family protein [Alphaproteobacteria bacterium]|nr:acyl-CoA dehydrogenase family protein [Alphaproteobacteria bacterium]
MRLSADNTSAEAAGSEYLQRAREFAPQLAAAAREIERRRELPESILSAMVERGFFRMLLPRSLGGAELLPVRYVRVVEEIAKADASTAWCLNQGAGCSMTAAYLDPAAAREIFGGPRGILAWGPGPGKARKVEGGYRVTASWSFASGSHNATWLGCHVPVFDESGAQLFQADGSPVIRTAMFPKSAAEMSDIWHVVGLRGTGSDKYSVSDLFVPHTHLAARDEDSTRRENGLLYRFSSLQLYASGFAGVAMGIARSTLDAFVELAADKVPFRGKRTLRENNVVQSQVAQAEARLRSARAFLYHSLDEITREVESAGRITLDQRMTIRLASTFAIHQSLSVVDTAYHAAGSTAIFEDNPFERRFRDIHTVSQQLQGRQEHFETVGQHLLGLEPDTLAWL